MTREELKENMCGMTYDDMFEYIYELESRVCGNCEFYINNEYHIGCSRFQISFNQPTFGCNEFLHKLESK